MNHSPTPWKVDSITGHIEDADGNTVVLGLRDCDMMLQDAENAKPVDLAYIVACVNACQNLDRDALLRGDIVRKDMAYLANAPPSPREPRQNL